MRRRLTHAGFLAVALTVASFARAQTPGGCTSRPNILIVALEGVRADATSLHPSPLNDTPALKKLAANGINFTHAYSASDFVTDGVFAILTAYKRGFLSPFDRVEATLQHQLRRQGYRSFAVLVNGNLSVSIVRATADFDQRVDLYEEWADLDEVAKALADRRVEERLARYGAASNGSNRYSLYASPGEVVSRTLAQVGVGTPFFGLVNLSAGDPWLPDPATYELDEPTPVPDLRERKLRGELADPNAIEDDVRREQVLRTIDRARGRLWSTTFDLMPEQLETYRRRYHAEVRDIDRAIEKLIESLKERQLLDSTIIVVTSVNGLAFGEADMIGNSFNNWGEVEATRRVPLLIKLPSCYGVAGVSVDARASTADIAPTLYALSGIDAAQLWGGARFARGRSLHSLIPDLQPIRAPVRRAYAPPLTPLGLLDDRQISIAGPGDIATTRDSLIGYVWGKDGYPARRMPDFVQRDVSVPLRPSGLLRTDKLRISLSPSLGADAYHLIPAKPNGELVIVHQGHDCRGLDAPGTGLPSLIGALVGRGYGVLGLEMPRQRPDDCSSVAQPHDELFATLHGDGTGFRFFFEPIAVSLNYLQSSAARDGFPAYRKFHMVGFSGGGWTASVFAALDDRIRTTITVAGSLPLYLRAGLSVGDVEQYEPGFYGLAGYLDLYVMGTFGAGRRQLQILNRRDDCCFGAAQHEGESLFDADLRSYEREVRSTLARLGVAREAFSVRIDESATTHTVSPGAIYDIILPALK